MFIENLRNVKKKWKVPALILIVLLVLGLLSSFAYLGTSFGGGSIGSNAEGIDYYATAAENAEKAAEKNGDDVDTLLQAVTAFDNYATYQVLYFDNGSAESYGKMRDYANKLLALYGGQETDDSAWADAYMYVIRADLALDDVDGAREAFNKSLSTITLTSDYLNNYSTALMTKELYDELVEDMNAAIAVLEPLAGDVEEDSEAEEDETETDTADSGEETMADVLSTAQSNLEYAKMMISANTATTESTDSDTTDEAAEDTAE